MGVSLRNNYILRLCVSCLKLKKCEVYMNRKGFMMAEVVVVSAIVLVTLTVLYTSYNKIYATYLKRINYYDTTTLYRLGFYRDILTNNFNVASDGEKTLLMNKIINDMKDNNTKVINISGSLLNDEIFKEDVLEYSQVDRVYMVYNPDDNLMVDNFNDFDLNLSFQDYITFLGTSTDIKSNYLMIMERCFYDDSNNVVNEDKCKYTYLEVYDGYEES